MSPPTDNDFKARGGGNRGPTSCPPSKAREFAPPVMATKPKAGNDGVGNTAQNVPHSRLKNRTRVDTMPTIFERETASPVESVDVSNTTSTAQSKDRSSHVKQGEFASKPGMPDIIHALEPTNNQRNNMPSMVLATLPGGDLER